MNEALMRVHFITNIRDQQLPPLIVCATTNEKSESQNKVVNIYEGDEFVTPHTSARLQETDAQKCSFR